MTSTVLTINGSYHRHGIISQATNVVINELNRRGLRTESINLIDCNIEFCTNCRQCTQQPGIEPGVCSIDDDMESIITKIEQTDSLILAAPVNFGAVTATYKRFMERLISYAYWPFERPYPDFRKKQSTKPTALITSTAMPGLMARYTTNAMHSLKFTAKTIGGKSVDKIYIGFAAGSEHMELTSSTVKRLHKAAARLA